MASGAKRTPFWRVQSESPAESLSLATQGRGRCGSSRSSDPACLLIPELSEFIKGVGVVQSWESRAKWTKSLQSFLAKKQNLIQKPPYCISGSRRRELSPAHWTISPPEVPPEGSPQTRVLPSLKAIGLDDCWCPYPRRILTGPPENVGAPTAVLHTACPLGSCPYTEPGLGWVEIKMYRLIHIPICKVGMNESMYVLHWVVVRK